MLPCASWIFIVSLLLAAPLAAETDADGEPEGYPAEPRQVETPGGVEDDLEHSFPNRDSVFPGLVPERWGKLKKKLFEKTGIKLATSYQNATYWASDVLLDPDYAAGGLYTLEAKWDAYRRGQDYQGSFVFAFNHGHIYGDAGQPFVFFLDTGSITAHDGVYAEIGPFISVLFWEQWLDKDRFVLRLGQLAPLQILDFFRFGDPRTSFSVPALAAPAASIPIAPPGPGVNFKWWPIEGSELYVVGLVNDINSTIDEFDWSTLFETGDVFAGFELGYNWKREGGEFDHAHLTLWYGDSASAQPWPSSSGWGLKLAGEKQLGQLVGFTNYAYNTSRGGGFGLTFNKHAFNVGLAYVKPFGIAGEVATAYTWVEALDGGGCGVVPCNGQQQSGLEFYWKVLLTPDLWVTPGLQIGINPALNPNVNAIAAPYIKARLFF